MRAMISGPSNASPGPGYFQAVQGLVRPEDAPGANPAAKPVTQVETPRPVQAPARNEAPPPHAEAQSDAATPAASFPRGSFLDISV